jgi:chromosome segregation ATPase/RNA polymerase subunit RPABC4/transcription elongation factor Spt4
LCKKCYENVKKQFKNCPLCRQANFTAKFSRLMVTVLSQYKLFCPAAECNESVPYANFAKHKESCPALNKKPCPHCKKLYWKNDFIDHFACFEELNKTAQEDKKKVVDLEWKVSELESKLGPITQSRDAHAQNNTTYKTKIRQLENDLAVEINTIENQDAVIESFANKIKELEQNLAADKRKIQNQRTSLSSLHKKANEYNVLEQKHEQLTTAFAGLTRRFAEAGQQAQMTQDQVKSSEMTISRLRSTINKTKNSEPKNIWNDAYKRASGELTSANQEVFRLRNRNRELEAELKNHQKKVKKNNSQTIKHLERVPASLDFSKNKMTRRNSKTNENRILTDLY